MVQLSNETKWWKKSVVYQIYPRSFYDTNGDIELISVKKWDLKPEILE